jgi:ribosomal protein S18 acetylase RimI-like enzyme
MKLNLLAEMMKQDGCMTQIQAIEENALTYYKGIARLLGGQYIEDEQIVWFKTGRRSLGRFNGVLRTVVSRAEDLGKVVDPILGVFLSQNLPFFWADLKVVGTPGLGDYLKSTGIAFAHFQNMPVMSRPLADLPQVSPPKEVDIVLAKNQNDQLNWLNVFMEGFEEPEPSRNDFQQFLANSLAESQPVFEHFLARWQGEPCAVSTLLRAKHGAGIYHVTTLRSYRGRGLGKALTLAAMQSAKSAGYAEAVLFATPSGYPIYQRLGFETVSTVDFFAWSGHG